MPRPSKYPEEFRRDLVQRTGERRDGSRLVAAVAQVRLGRVSRPVRLRRDTYSRFARVATQTLHLLGECVEPARELLKP
ncbi:MAG: hypothetical protein ACRDSS_02910, partial [Actinocrinis sp.]